MMQHNFNSLGILYCKTLYFRCVLISRFWNVEISLHFSLAFSGCSTSIYPASGGQTEFSLVFHFAMLSYSRPFLPGAARWFSAVSSAVHLRRRHAVPTKTPVGLHPPIICLFRPSDFLLLDVAPSLLLAFGTIYLWTLPSHRRSLFTFKRHLRINLFRHSYPDLAF